MSNMSYCRFENTLSDLWDCYHALDEDDMDELSKDEENAMKALIRLCSEIHYRFRNTDEE